MPDQSSRRIFGRGAASMRTRCSCSGNRPLNRRNAAYSPSAASSSGREDSSRKGLTMTSSASGRHRGQLPSPCRVEPFRRPCAEPSGLHSVRHRGQLLSPCEVEPFRRPARNPPRLHSAAEGSARLDLAHRSPARDVRCIHVDDLWLRGDEIRSLLDEILERLRPHVRRTGGRIPEPLHAHERVGLLEALRPLEEEVALLLVHRAGVLAGQRRPLGGTLGTDRELDDDQDHERSSARSCHSCLRRRQNWFPSGSSSTCQPSSPVCPTSARVAPRDSRRSSSASWSRSVGLRSMCSRTLPGVGSLTGANSSVGTRPPKPASGPISTPPSSSRPSTR